MWGRPGTLCTGSAARRTIDSPRGRARLQRLTSVGRFKIVHFGVSSTLKDNPESVAPTQAAADHAAYIERGLVHTTAMVQTIPVPHSSTRLALGAANPTLVFRPMPRPRRTTLWDESSDDESDGMLRIVSPSIASVRSCLELNSGRRRITLYFCATCDPTSSAARVC